MIRIQGLACLYVKFPIVVGTFDYLAFAFKPPMPRFVRSGMRKNATAAQGTALMRTVIKERKELARDVEYRDPVLCCIADLMSRTRRQFLHGTCNDLITRGHNALRFLRSQSRITQNR